MGGQLPVPPPGGAAPCHASRVPSLRPVARHRLPAGLTRAISSPQPSQSPSSGKHASSTQPEAMEVALDPNGSQGPNGSSQHNAMPSFPNDAALDLTRRTGLLAVVAATLWAGLMGPQSATDQRAIQSVVANVTFQDARYACVDAAGVCSTLYSQMSSTLRQLTAGYIPDDVFQAACARRLSSPFIQEAMIGLEESLPVLGVELAYSPDLSGTGWLMAASGHPRLNPAARERFEGMTLRALQRCRRVQRLSVAMSENKYTPAAVQLLAADLKELSRILDEMLSEVDKLVNRKRAAAK